MPNGDDLAPESTAAPTSELPLRELRIAASFSGGVSLAVWMGGLTSELDRLLRAADDLQAGTAEPSSEAVDVFYRRLLELLRIDVDVDVITGTSAGGINGAALAMARVHGGSLEPLQAIWREQGSFTKLLRDPAAPEPASMMQGDDVLLRGLESGLEEIVKTAKEGWGRRTGPEGGFRSRDNALTLLVTSTMMQPETTTVRDALGTAVLVKDNQALFRFEQPVGESGTQTFAVNALARVARSSASYPVGFEPSWVKAGQGLSRDGWLMDGGLRNNQPVGPALREVWNQPAGAAARRVMLHIVPDPGQARVAVPADPAAVPNVLKAAGTTVAAPFVQSWTADLQETRRRSKDAQRRTAGSIALMDALNLNGEAMTGLLKRLRNQRKIWVVRDFLAELDKQRSRAGVLTDAVAGPGEGSTEFDALRAQCQAVAAQHWADDLSLPVDATQLAQFGPDLYNAAFLNALERVRLMEGGGAPLGDKTWGEAAVALHASREAGVTTRWEREHLRTFLQSKIATDAKPSVTTASAWFAAWLDGAFPQPSATADGTDAIARLRPSWKKLLTWTSDWTPFGPQTNGSNPLVIRAAAWLLQAGADYETPEVELVQMSAYTGTLLDPTNRFVTPEQKLTGVSLSHFGAFINRACRENDWMWGRLDGVGWLVHLLLQPSRLREIAATGGSAAAIAQLRLIATGGDANLESFWEGALTSPALISELAALAGDSTLEALPELSKLVASGIQFRIAREGLTAVGQQMITREDGGQAQLTSSEAEQRQALSALALLPQSPVPVTQIQTLLMSYTIPKTSFDAIMGKKELRDTAYRAVAVATGALDWATPSFGPLKKITSQVAKVSRGAVNSLTSGFVAGKAALVVLAVGVLLLIIGNPAIKAVAIPLVIAAGASLATTSAVSKKSAWLPTVFWFLAVGVALGVGLFYGRKWADWLPAQSWFVWAVVSLVGLAVLLLAWLLLIVFRFLRRLRSG